MENRTSSPQSVLSATVYVMNSILGPEGLVPFLLVFGMVPRISLGNSNASKHTSQQVRLKVLKQAREEYEGIVAQLRLKTARVKRLPSIDQLITKPSTNQLVLVNRERPKKMGRAIYFV